jgi:hypothetical protein
MTPHAAALNDRLLVDAYANLFGKDNTRTLMKKK